MRLMQPHDVKATYASNLLLRRKLVLGMGRS